MIVEGDLLKINFRFDSQLSRVSSKEKTGTCFKVPVKLKQINCN